MEKLHYIVNFKQFTDIMKMRRENMEKEIKKLIRRLQIFFVGIFLTLIVIGLMLSYDGVNLNTVKIILFVLMIIFASLAFSLFSVEERLLEMNKKKSPKD